MSKTLHMMAGGTDGYVNIVFSFDASLLDKLEELDPESYSGNDSYTSIQVPNNATYESLDIPEWSTAEYDMAQHEDEEE